MASFPAGNLIDGSLTASGSAQDALAANISRQYLFLQNISDADFWVNFGTAAVADKPSILLKASDPRPYIFDMAVPTGKVSVIGTSGKKIVVKEA